MPIPLDQSVGQFLSSMFEGQTPPPRPQMGDVATRRSMGAAFTDITNAMASKRAEVSMSRQEITMTEYRVQCEDDVGHQVKCCWFSPSQTTPDGPAMIYLHSGGMIMLSVDMVIPTIEELVRNTGVPILAIDYQLAPEARAPTQVLEAYAGLTYLVHHAREFGIDPKRIAVMGESGGGGLAACLTHYVKQRTSGPRLCKQILIAPMLDDRTTGPDPELSPTAFWSYDDNATAWAAVLGESYGSLDIPVTSVAGRMTIGEARDLPPAYIDVGDLDIFRDEIMVYSSKLLQGGVSTELHVLPGLTHAFDVLARDNEAVVAVVEARYRAINSF